MGRGPILGGSRTAAVWRRSHGNRHVTDVDFKSVLMSGGEMAKRKYEAEYLKCVFW